MSAYPNYVTTSAQSVPKMPSHWRLKRLKHLVTLNYGDALSAEIRINGDVDVYGSNGVVGKHNVANTDAPVIVVGRKGSYGKMNYSLEPAFCIDTAYHVSQSNAEADLRFMFYAMQPLKLDTLSQDTGVPGLSREVAYVQHLPLPPIDEQIAIAAYLDAETKRIDELIQEKQRLVSLLHELRGSIVRELTAGLHLNGPRRDTGNVFTPTIPSAWQMVPIGRYSSIGNGSTPLKDNADYWEGGTYPWLNSAVVNQDEVHEGSEFVTDAALRQCHLPIVPAGSVLIALTGQGKTRGKVTVLRIEATINQHLASIRPDPEKLDGEFVFWALSGQYQALRMVSDGQGGTKGALTCDELARFQIPFPSLIEQTAIAARLYEDTRRVDELIDHANREVELLLEMRSGTITDAVLGRIDVRENAMIEPARGAIA